MLTVSFQSGHDKKGFEQWINDMSSAGLEEFNNAGMDYGSYKTLGIEKAGDFAKEDSVIGKLATRIERSTGKGNNLNLRLLVWSTVAEPLPELIKQVKKASQTAR
jgi:hypothetical protein